jgi:hypothetical protein
VVMMMNVDQQQIVLAVCLYQIEKIKHIKREKFLISHVRFSHECCANFIRSDKKEKAKEKYEGKKTRKELDELFSLLLLTSSFSSSRFFGTLQYLMK